MSTRRRSSKIKWIVPAAVLILAAAAAAYFFTPGVSRPQAGTGDLLLTMEEDGTVLLTWPEPSGGALSRVTLRSGEGEEQALEETQKTSAVLDAALLDQPLHVTVQAVVRVKNLLGMERELVSRDALAVTVQPYAAPRPVLEGESGEPGELKLSWTDRGNYELGILEEGACRPFKQVGDRGAVLTFGEEGELPLPSYDDPAQITLRAVREGEGYLLCGPWSEPLQVMRESLLGSELSLERQDLGERLYALRWNETKGDRYEIQEWSAGEGRWETLAQIARTEPLRYETGMLRSGSDHRYRVVSLGGDPAEPVEPAELSFRAEISTRYATVWPVVDVDFFEDAALTGSLGRIPAGTALCVLDEQPDVFQVRWKDQYGWVDSRFCMINLPEYIGDVCAYDITNSYSSIFMVHDSPIRDITGQVIQGFEGIRTAEGGFLVPYLYPCARKLLTAAQAAERDGYRLRIYEAFRPNEATRFLYDTTLEQINYPLPTFDEETGEYVFYEPPEEPEETRETAENAPEDPEIPENETPPGEGLPGESAGETAPVLPEEDVPEEPASPEEDAAPPPEESGEPADPEGPEPQLPPLQEDGEPQLPDGETGLLPEEDPPEVPEEELPEGPTFLQVMTDGRFGINSFLAAAVSNHNRGIALDLTIEYLDGRPLDMQSAMHDLSWYSATYLNNANAKLLASYMTMPGVAFRGLTSEWWHFQDDDTRNALSLGSYLYKGVTAEGWTRDNIGWRYRDAAGNYLRDTTVKIGGKHYTLDSDGYAQAVT